MASWRIIFPTSRLRELVFAAPTMILGRSTDTIRNHLVRAREASMSPANRAKSPGGTGKPLGIMSRLNINWEEGKYSRNELHRL
jgi:hypothetical protein